jgi:hypothetical protein
MPWNDVATIHDYCLNYNLLDMAETPLHQYGFRIGCASTIFSLSTGQGPP